MKTAPSRALLNSNANVFVRPGELARLSVPRGTTTILADANCIANVLGGRGMEFMGLYPKLPV